MEEYAQNAQQVYNQNDYTLQAADRLELCNDLVAFLDPYMGLQKVSNAVTNIDLDCLQGSINDLYE